MYFYKFGVDKVMQFQELYEAEEVKEWYQVKEIFEDVGIHQQPLGICEMATRLQFQKAHEVPASQFHLELSNRFQVLAVPDEDEALQIGKAQTGVVEACKRWTRRRSCRSPPAPQEIDQVQSFEEVLQEWGWQSWNSGISCVSCSSS